MIDSIKIHENKGDKMAYIYVVFESHAHMTWLYSASYESFDSAVEDCIRANKTESDGYHIGRVPTQTFLEAYHGSSSIIITALDDNGKPIKTDTPASVSAKEILDVLDGEDGEYFYVILDYDEQILSVWEHYDEEEMYREFDVGHIGRVKRIECRIAAEENATVDITDTEDENNFFTVNAQDILESWFCND